PLLDIFQFKKATTKNIEDNDINNIYIRNGGYSKGIFVKRIKTAAEPNWPASHLSFYNFYDYEAAPHLHYVGRFTADEYNLALGIFSLQYLKPTGISWKGYNTAYGHHTLESNEGGIHNTAIGYGVLANNTVSGSTGVGSHSLFENTTGIYNTALGAGALKNNEIGHKNTAVGAWALQNYKGDGADEYNGYNVAVGWRALQGEDNSNYQKNVAIGPNAMAHISGTANNNIAIGNQPIFGGDGLGHIIFTGSHNIVLGFQAGYDFTEAYDNIAIGKQALYKNTKGYGNIAIGSQALFNNTEGYNNIAIGNRSLMSVKPNASGVHNDDLVAVGNRSLELFESGLDNMAVGSNTLSFLRKGDHNTAFGQSVLFHLGCSSPSNCGTTVVHPGDYNTGVGSNAITLMADGYDNTALGSHAMLDIGYGDDNTAVGSLALAGNATYLSGGGTPKSGVKENTAVGKGALQYVADNAIGNVAVGFEAMHGGDDANFYDADYNIAIGHKALYSMQGSSSWLGENIAIGHNALASFASAGGGNVAIGGDALANAGAADRTGCYTLGRAGTATCRSIRNTAVGQNAMKAMTDGIDNTSLGAFALGKNNGDQNVAIGSEALESNTTGKNNVVIGYGALMLSQKGSNNVVIGSDVVSWTTKTVKNSIFIGAGLYDHGYESAGADGILAIGLDDNPLIEGKLNGSKWLKVNGDFSYTSDARLKNIKGDFKAGLDEINKIEVKKFTFKNDKAKKLKVGVIAQQLQKVFPNSVLKGDDGYLMINTDEMFYAMINSIKQLYAKFQDLAAKVTGLDKRLTELEKKNADLEKRLKKLEEKAN
ncbi:tail fiber domain-containing protein, partial [bacterium]|nr:tail fiber domain-containing protein [bacterium]